MTVDATVIRVYATAAGIILVWLVIVFVSRLSEAKDSDD